MDLLSNILRELSQQSGAHFDRQNAGSKHRRALKRVTLALPSDHTGRFKQSRYNSTSRKWLADSNFERTHAPMGAAQRPATGREPGLHLRSAPASR